MRRKIYKFPSGATLIYRKRKSNKATALNAGFFCGHQYENNGLPHFFEHMLFKGTTKRSMEQIIDDRTAIAFLNAYTNTDLVCVNFYQSNKRINECFEYASDVLLNSTFEQEKLANEVKVIKEEKVRYLDRGQKDLGFMHEMFIKKDYETPEKYANTMFGTDEFLNNISSKDLFDFREKHFVSDKFIVSVVSSLSFNKIKKLVKKYFLSNLKKPKEKSHILPMVVREINQEQGVNIIKNNDIGYKAMLTIKMNVEPLTYRYDYNLDCLSDTLALRKDLYHYQVREQGLAYSCRTGVDYNGLSNTLWLGVDFTTSSIENIEKILNILGDSIVKLKKEGLSQSEIDLYKENYIISRDTKRTSSYKDMVQDILNAYIKYGKEKPKTQRQYIKFYDKITTSSIKEHILKCFNKNNDIHLSIMGNIDESKIKSIEEYENLIFKEVE